MDEAAVQPKANGRKSTTESLNETATQGKRGRQRPMRSIAQMGAAEDMKEVQHSYRVDNVATDWKFVPNFSKFSRSSDGSFPCVKSSKSSFIDLERERQETNIFAGSVYRLY
jgi:hypothetical protein